VSPQSVPQEEQSKAAKKAGEDAQQQVAPGTEQLAPEIPRHSRKCILGVANCTVERPLQPAVHLLLRRCQSLRQARLDDRMDDSSELLPRLLCIASEDGLTGDGIVEAGLDILQKLPGRHPGLFGGPLRLSGRKSAISRVSPQSLACSAAASFSPRQSPRHIFEGAALHHSQLIAEPFLIFRVHLAKLLDQIEENPFSRLHLWEGEVNPAMNPGGFVACCCRRTPVPAAKVPKPPWDLSRKTMKKNDLTLLIA
jgi:hypothetical protein